MCALTVTIGARNAVGVEGREPNGVELRLGCDGEPHREALAAALIRPLSTVEGVVFVAACTRWFLDLESKQAVASALEVGHRRPYRDVCRTRTRP